MASGFRQQQKKKEKINPTYEFQAMSILHNARASNNSNISQTDFPKRNLNLKSWKKTLFEVGLKKYLLRVLQLYQLAEGCKRILVACGHEEEAGQVGTEGLLNNNNYNY